MRSKLLVIGNETELDKYLKFCEKKFNDFCENHYGPMSQDEREEFEYLVSPLKIAFGVVHDIDEILSVKAFTQDDPEFNDIINGTWDSCYDIRTSPYEHKENLIANEIFEVGEKEEIQNYIDNKILQLPKDQTLLLIAYHY